MLTIDLVKSIICDEFRETVGKWQVKKPTRQAMMLSFRLSIGPDEEGYRWMDMIIYSPMNYVQVYFRERYNVIPTEDMELLEGTEDEMVPKPGKDYQEGATDWKKVADHDSCWPDGVRRTLDEYERKILGMAQQRWYRIVEVPKEIDNA